MPSIPIKDRKFDTQVQYLKYKVLREVARYAFEDRLLDAYTEIPKLIVAWCNSIAHSTSLDFTISTKVRSLGSER